MKSLNLFICLFISTRRNRKKKGRGGGGLLAYVDSNLSSNKRKLKKVYKTLEVRNGSKDVLFLDMYRPLTQSSQKRDSQYLERVEEELNDVCMWASLMYHTVVFTGDSNLKRLKPESKEGKILADFEEVHGMECLVTKPTRITPTSETMLDVIVAKKPGIFKVSDSFNPEISVHHLIYGILAHAISQHSGKIIHFGRTKNVDMDKLNEHLLMSMRNGIQLFYCTDEQYDTWNTIFEGILD